MPRRSSRFAGLMLDGRIVSAGGIVRTAKVGVDRQIVDDTGVNDAATVRTPTGAGESTSLEVTLAWDDASELTSVLERWSGARGTPRTWCYAPETNRPGSRVWMGQGLHVQSDPVEPQAGDLTLQGLTIVLSGPTTRGRLIAWDAEIAGPNGNATRAARQVDLIGPPIPLAGAPPTRGTERRIGAGVREIRDNLGVLTGFDCYFSAEPRLQVGDTVVFDRDLTDRHEIRRVVDRNHVDLDDSAHLDVSPVPTTMQAVATGPAGAAAGWVLMAARITDADGATALRVLPQHRIDTGLAVAWDPIGVAATHPPASWPRAEVFAPAAGVRLRRWLGYTWAAPGAGAGFRGRVTAVAAITGGNR